MPDIKGSLTPPSEPMMQWRLVVAFLAMGAVLFLSPYFYKRFSPPPATTTRTEPPKEVNQQPPAPPPKRVAAPAVCAPPPAQASAQQEQSYTVDTDLYHIEFSNRGATVRKWVLKKFKDSAGNPLDLVAPGASKASYPFSLAFPEAKPAVDVNNVLFRPSPAPDGIDYLYSDGNVCVSKSFRFDRNGYLSQFASAAAQGGAGLPHLIEWRGGFGDTALQNAVSQQRTVNYNLDTNSLSTHDAKEAEAATAAEAEAARAAEAARVAEAKRVQDAEETRTDAEKKRKGAKEKREKLITAGRLSFAGIEDTYFAAVFLPPADGQVEIRTISDNVQGAPGQGAQPHVGARVGGAAENQFSVFVGPKKLDLLKKASPRLEQMVDFGWFWFIAKPLFLVLNWLNDKLAEDYGWAIVLLTILINFAILPMRLKSMKSMKRMQALQPQIAAINAKYKNVGMRDPRKAQQNEEVMGLYKKHGVNPMGGCLPMLLQIPVFYGFYKVLTVAIEMRGAHWLWVTDLSQPEHLPIRILPIAMIVAQFVMQKMTPNPSVDPNQQRMMMLLPLVFGFMFYGVASGLVLYWLTSNLVGIVQQWFINRSMGVAGAGAAPPPVVAAKPKKGGGRR
jgi:YidC/Oxa1 family membrane protein insertase